MRRRRKRKGARKEKVAKGEREQEEMKQEEVDERKCKQDLGRRVRSMVEPGTTG